MKEHYYPGARPLNGVELNLFSEEDLRMIHSATMEVFQNPGVQVSDAEARQIFKEAGCEVDEKSQVVKIPEYLVNRALMDAPSRFTLWGRDKKNNTVQEHKGKVNWTCFGTGVKMCNYEAPGKYKTVDLVSGLLVCKEILADSYLLDGFYTKGQFVNRNSTHCGLGHLYHIVVEYELLKGEGHTKFKHTCTIEGVTSGKCRKQGSHCLLVTCLAIRNLGISLGTCNKGRETIELCKFTDCRTD